MIRYAHPSGQPLAVTSLRYVSRLFLWGRHRYRLACLAFIFNGLLTQRTHDPGKCLTQHMGMYLGRPHIGMAK